MTHAVLVLAASVSWLAAAQGDAVDAYVRSQLAARRLPGVSLAVVKDGRIVMAAGYGVASLELHAPATERTVYEIGSISKQIAANAILLLVEDGKVGLDDLISKYVDGAPAAWSGITVRHVLTHTAGLADFDTGGIGFSYRREYTNAEFVELLSARPLQFAPGERWNYTNAFPLLGMVVQRASGQPYPDFVRARIFAPLKLASARFKVSTDVVRHRADGYLFKDGEYRHGEALRPMVIAPNGGVMIDVLDFAAWDIAVTSGRLLKKESLDTMTTPVRLNDGRTVSHGLGWFIDTFNGHTFGAHWGTTVTGHSAVIRRYPADGLTVIMMANLDDGAFGIDAMSIRIAGMYVPGTSVHSLTPRPDASGRIAVVRPALEAIGQGVETPDAPGLAARLPADVRARIGGALRESTAFEFLGEEAVSPHHFSLDTAVASIARFRSQGVAGARYFTVRFTREGRMLAVTVED